MPNKEHSLEASRLDKGREFDFCQFGHSLDQNSEYMVALMGMDALMVNIDHWTMMAPYAKMHQKRHLVLIRETLAKHIYPMGFHTMEPRNLRPSLGHV